MCLFLFFFLFKPFKHVNYPFHFSLEPHEITLQKWANAENMDKPGQKSLEEQKTGSLIVKWGYRVQVSTVYSKLSIHSKILSLELALCFYVLLGQLRELEVLCPIRFGLLLIKSVLGSRRKFFQ